MYGLWTTVSLVKDWELDSSQIFSLHSTVTHRLVGAELLVPPLVGVYSLKLLARPVAKLTLLQDRSTLFVHYKDRNNKINILIKNKLFFLYIKKDCFIFVLTN